jgi:hypothetical protein
MRTEAVACFVLGAVLMAATGTVDGAAADEFLGARSWPFAIGCVLVAINLPEIFGVSNSAGRSEGYGSIHWVTFLRTALPVLALPLLIEGFGFLLGSVAAMAWFLIVVGYRHRVVAAAFSLCFPLITVYFFTKVAYMPLPRGHSPFDEFSVLILRAMGAY